MWAKNSELWTPVGLIGELLHAGARQDLGKDVSHHRVGVLVDAGAECLANGLSKDPRADGGVAASLVYLVGLSPFNRLHVIDVPWELV